MLSKKTIAVIGGTGKSGKFLVRELIRQNISFRILLRNPTTYTHSAGEIIHGDVRDAQAVKKLVEGCDAIIRKAPFVANVANPVKPGQ